MLIGEYNHTIDSKRRVSMPAKFRKALGSRVVVTHGLDQSLFVFATKQWQTIVEKLSTLSMGSSDSRAFNRFLLAGAVDLEIDSLGRILLPDYLAEFAALDTKATLIGVSDRVEIWNEERWESYKKRIESDADVMAEKLGELGVL
ncbi:division/cell wall cluster transcriptional repressor MraZ [Patescibacteria group bacterium]|jgi:MraZ protein|nr:division/cell wall cluster transcriptional repressor MraZ [Patescibacteria group bacterium]